MLGTDLKPYDAVFRKKKMHKASPPTSADEIPAEAISEVMEHTVTMFLENTKEKDEFTFFNWRASLYHSSYF